MKVVTGGEVFDSGMVVTLGNFDGLHRGHMKLVNKLIEVAARTNRESLVYVIENTGQDRIQSKSKQLDILDRAGVDYVAFKEFSDEFKNIEADIFLRNLKDRFRVERVVVGDDYRFGRKRQGDISSIKKFFEVDVVERVDEVSSTAIRDMIREGKVECANSMLGREFSLEGEVVEGLKNGRKIGFRTANLREPDGMIIPKVGVYKTRTKYNNNIYTSITNIGTNPTIGGLSHVSIETNILDFSEDIYGKSIEVSFLRRLRGERKFNSIEELVKKIAEDIQKIRESE